MHSLAPPHPRIQTKEFRLFSNFIVSAVTLKGVQGFLNAPFLNGIARETTAIPPYNLGFKPKVFVYARVSSFVLQVATLDEL